MAAVVIGWKKITLARDDEGHRTYKVTWRVATTSTADGPAVVYHAIGLPQPGATYLFGNDIDVWAWCRPAMTIEPVYSGEPTTEWDVVQTFSTKPPTHQHNRPQNNEIQDPLLEPQKVSGSFVKYKQEAVYDMNGNPIRNSAWEQLRGPTNEWDSNHPTVKIEQNVPQLQLGLVSQMVDTVNVAPMWGLNARMIKLSNASWERKFYKMAELYFVRSLEFDIDYNTFDRNLLDEGTKVLHGHWGVQSVDMTTAWVLDQIGGVNPDPGNPAHFDRFKDRNGENAKVILDGHGQPSGGATGTANNAGNIFVQKYPASDFTMLNIPLNFTFNS